ncbi:MULTISPECIES: ABC transporter substrate-binding protein [unclassified Streptomyces]|uniref:ABC transporter substrate-binding protein n=1 Tax=unclassified Streptomyces TaxID=2593676 RepID=UPI002E28A268|nr:ABC transporter substrate-binding protein [Streptomyces sp. NBC_00223]
MRRPRNRTLGVLAVCLALLAGAGVVAVRAATAWHGSVTLLANWTGRDEDQFRRKVLDPFEKKYRIHVVYQGSSAESQVLAADVESGTPPDLVVLPGPGELADYARQGRLVPLDGLVRAADFGATWAPKAKGADDRVHTYWVPVKADLKSMVWYPSGLAADRLTALAGQPASWCLGMGSDATSGWPGTDWLEDILLQQAGPEVYQRWATGRLTWKDPRVLRAWRTWGTLVGAGREPYARRALITDYDAASAGVAAHPPTCRLEHQATFVRGSKAWQTVGAAYTHSAALIPGAAVDSAAWEVSGDLAAVLRDTPQAGKLIGYLASESAQRAWSTTQAGFSADTRVPLSAYARLGPTAESIARTLSDPHAVRCYDASDAMPPAMRDAFDLTVLRFLADPSTLDGRLTVLDDIRTRAGSAWLPTVCGGG